MELAGGVAGRKGSIQAMIQSTRNLGRRLEIQWKGTWVLMPLNLAILALVIAACGSERQIPPEEQAQSIDRSLMCPVCPSETIDQAQVPLAHQMRAVVREKLGDGWSREQILQFFVDRYGQGVLAEPPKRGFNLVAWVVPLAAVAAAVVLLGFVL